MNKGPTGEEGIGRTRVPLREAHAHVHQLGRALRAVDLGACGSPAEMLDALGAAAGCPAGGAGAPVIAFGARPEAWTPPRWPGLADLDRVTGGTPALAWCFDYHALTANSATLALAGIGRGSPDPDGGIVERDGAGRPTGLLYEKAALRAWESLPEPSPEERERDLVEGARRLESRFAEVHDLKSPAWMGPALRRLSDRGELAGRYVLFPLLADLGEVLASRRTWESERVRLGGAKVFVDGTLNSRTAWMLAPYADGRPEHPRGTPMMSAEEIEGAVRRCDGAGLPLAAHAIGDGAVRAVLDALERVRPRTRGFRIEHAEVIDEADVARFAELGVIASVQPCHLLADIEALRRAIPHRMGRVLPLRELIDAGCVPGDTLLFGSDVPIVRSDPEDSILAATARRRAGMPADEAIAPEQAISAPEAWRCFG